MDSDLLIILVAIALAGVYVFSAVFWKKAEGAWLKICLAEGKKLEQEGRHSAAYKEFERAYRWTPFWRRQTRAIVASRLAVSANRCRKPGKALKWAQVAIALQATPGLFISAHIMAAAALSAMGRYNEAATYAHTTRELAARYDLPDKAAIASGQLAKLYSKKGQFEEAVQFAEQALTEGGKQRNLLISLAVALRGLGRYPEARDAISRARSLPPLKFPHLEQRVQAVMALSQSWIEAEMRLGEPAWEHLQEALGVLANDERHGDVCRATAPWILAVRGRTQEAMESIDQLEAGSGRKGSSGLDTEEQEETDETKPDTSNTHGLLGYATFELRDYRRSKSYWEKRVAQKLSPNNRTTAYYFLGACQERLGDLDSARESYRQCLEMNVHSYHARLAGERLQEIGSATTPA